MLTSRGLDRVLGDLSTMGYNAVWGTVSAADAGAPHRRDRIWILAYAADAGLHERRGSPSTEQDVFGIRGNERHGIPGGAHQEVEPLDAGQHPIGQLADTDMLGCLHGQAEERPTKGGVHAQREPEPSGEDVAHANIQGLQGAGQSGQANHVKRKGTELRGATTERCGWWSVEPGLGGVFDELADRLDLHGTPEPGSVPRVATGIHKRADRLKAIGNGQVPLAAAMAYSILYNRINRVLGPW